MPKLTPPGPRWIFMDAFLVSLLVVALAEVGDKTQILSMILAAQFRQPVPIMFGIFFATIANHAAAGLAGTLFGDLLSGSLMRWVLGLSFLSVAVWALFPSRQVCLAASILWLGENKIDPRRPRSRQACQGTQMKLLHVCTILLGLVPTAAFAGQLGETPLTPQQHQGISNSNTIGNPTYAGQKTDRIYNQVAPTGGEYPGGVAACRARGHGPDYCFVHCGNDPANRDLCK